jgi:Glycosyl transferase family 2
LCRGEYIARIDHDDLAEPGRLRKQAEFLDANPSVTVVGSQIRLFGQEDSVTDFPLDDASIKGRFLQGAAYLANPSAMFRREFIQQHAIRYDPKLDIVDDLGFWFDCMLHGACFANLPEPLTAYRIHSSMTSKNLNGARLYDAKVRLYSGLLSESDSARRALSEKRGASRTMQRSHLGRHQIESSREPSRRIAKLQLSKTKAPLLPKRRFTAHQPIIKPPSRAPAATNPPPCA